MVAGHRARRVEVSEGEVAFVDRGDVRVGIQVRNQVHHRPAALADAEADRCFGAGLWRAAHGQGVAVHGGGCARRRIGELDALSPTDSGRDSTIAPLLASAAACGTNCTYARYRPAANVDGVARQVPSELIEGCRCWKPVRSERIR